MQGPLFLSHTSKLNQQKQLDVVSKSTAKMYSSNKYNIFPSFIIDQVWNTLILCWASTHLFSVGRCVEIYAPVGIFG